MLKLPEVHEETPELHVLLPKATYKLRRSSVAQRYLQQRALGSFRWKTNELGLRNHGVEDMLTTSYVD